MNIPKQPHATTEQQIYIQQLAIDLRLTLKARMILISDKINREIGFLDELTKSEASKIIIYFKEMKENGRRPETPTEIE